MKKFDTALERAYVNICDFSEDFKEGCQLSEKNVDIFNENDILFQAYRGFFNRFASHVKERCFASCINLLDKWLGYNIRIIVENPHTWEFSYESSIGIISKYFSLSNFYGSIYREMDYEFFVCFDQYLNQRPSVFSNSDSLALGLDKIHILDVFDYNRFSVTPGDILRYGTFYKFSKYGVLHDAGLASVDGLRLLASMPSEEGLKIFSYLLRRYKFSFYDIINLSEILIWSGNASYLSVLVNNYDFFDSNNSAFSITPKDTDYLNNVRKAILGSLLSIKRYNCDPVCFNIFVRHFDGMFNLKHFIS